MTRGNYLETHTVAKQATQNASRRAGSFGQYLTTSTTPSAWVWAFPDNAGAAGETVATSTIWDAKGDLVAATGADAATKLTVGANNTRLTADSAQSNGLKWTAALASASYKRTSGSYTTTSATFVDVDNTNLALTITTLARRVLIGFTGTIKHSSTVATSFTVDLDGTNLGAALGSTGYGGLVTARPGTANFEGNVSFTFLTDVLTAASHTFKLQWVTAAATATLYGTTGTVNNYCQFWVAEQDLWT
jgi:hypothetical protein